MPLTNFVTKPFEKGFEPRKSGSTACVLGHYIKRPERRENACGKTRPIV